MSAATAGFGFTVFGFTVFGSLRTKPEPKNRILNNGKPKTRRQSSQIRGSLVATLCALFSASLSAQQPTVIPPGSNTIVVDAFDSVSHWSPAFADGVDVSVHPD